MYIHVCIHVAFLHYLEVEDDAPEDGQCLLAVPVHQSLGSSLLHCHVPCQAGQSHLHIVQPLLVCVCVCVCVCVYEHSVHVYIANYNYTYNVCTCTCIVGNHGSESNSVDLTLPHYTKRCGEMMMGCYQLTIIYCGIRRP